MEKGGGGKLRDLPPALGEIVRTVLSQEGVLSAGREVAMSYENIGGGPGGKGGGERTELMAFLGGGDGVFDHLAGAVRDTHSEIRENIRDVRRQGNAFFVMTIVCAVLGFIIILLGVSLELAGRTGAGLGGAAVGLVPELIAGVFFRKDRQLREFGMRYHERLLEYNQMVVLMEVAETLEGSARNTVKKEIIVRLLNEQCQ